MLTISGPYCCWCYDRVLPYCRSFMLLKFLGLIVFVWSYWNWIQFTRAYLTGLGDSRRSQSGWDIHSSHLILRHLVFADGNTVCNWTEIHMCRSLLVSKHRTVAILLYLTAVVLCCISLNTHMNCLHLVWIFVVWLVLVYGEILILWCGWYWSTCLLVQISLKKLPKLCLAKLIKLFLSNFICFVSLNLFSCSTTVFYLLRWMNASRLNLPW